MAQKDLVFKKGSENELSAWDCLLNLNYYGISMLFTYTMHSKEKPNPFTEDGTWCIKIGWGDNVSRATFDANTAPSFRKLKYVIENMGKKYFVDKIESDHPRDIRIKNIKSRVIIRFILESDKNDSEIFEQIDGNREQKKTEIEIDMHETISPFIPIPKDEGETIGSLYSCIKNNADRVWPEDDEDSCYDQDGNRIRKNISLRDCGKYPYSVCNEITLRRKMKILEERISKKYDEKKCDNTKDEALQNSPIQMANQVPASLENKDIPLLLSMMELLELKVNYLEECARLQSKIMLNYRHVVVDMLYSKRDGLTFECKNQSKHYLDRFLRKIWKQFLEVKFVTYTGLVLQDEEGGLDPDLTLDDLMLVEENFGSKYKNMYEYFSSKEFMNEAYDLEVDSRFIITHKATTFIRKGPIPDEKHYVELEKHNSFDLTFDGPIKKYIRSLCMDTANKNPTETFKIGCLTFLTKPKKLMVTWIHDSELEWNQIVSGYIDIASVDIDQYGKLEIEVEEFLELDWNYTSNERSDTDSEDDQKKEVLLYREYDGEDPYSYPYREDLYGSGD